MNKSLIAYDTDELEKNAVQKQAALLCKSKIISTDQLAKIRSEFVCKLYTPSLLMRAVFFILSLFGLLTLMFPAFLIFQSNYRIGMLLIGFGLLIFTEAVLIRQYYHYKTGITEALIYTGLIFIFYGLLGFDAPEPLILASAGFIFAAFAAIRYLDLLAVILSIGFFSWLIFQILNNIGGYAQAIIPFVFMTLFGLMYWISKIVQKQLSGIYLTRQFIVFQTLALILFYLAGNYFVVRELSVNMLNLKLQANQDIPFAILFYGLTALIPLFYFYRGVKNKSPLLIRTGLLTVALSVVTFKYYFSLGMPVVTVTIAGAILISIALFVINYLKQPRRGFTREKLLHSDWNSPELFAAIAAQTLGENQIDQPADNDFDGGQGGEFGGGGANGKW